MPLHPVIAQALASPQEAPDGPPQPEILRAGEAAAVPPLDQRRPVHRVEDMVATTSAGEVPVRVYTPDAAPTHGIIVYLHGGAFFLGSLDTHDHVARELANTSGRTVVSAGFRLAPEHAFPAGLEDCWGVLTWVTESADQLGWNGETLAVAGDSSGGTFAAALAARAHDEGFTALTHQILLYPSLDLDFDEDRWPSLKENAVGYGLETAGLKPFNAFYVDSGADPADPRVSPIKREDLSGLAPALVVTAEYDPLRDEGEAYARRLAEAGVPSRLVRMEGAGHGFVQHFGDLPEMHRVYDEIADFLASPTPR